MDGLWWNLKFAFLGALSQAINEVSGNTQNTSDGQKTRMVFFTSALVFVVVMWLVEFLILVVLIKFYIYLKEQDNKVIGSPFGHSAPTNGSRRVLERLETSELP